MLERERRVLRQRQEETRKALGRIGRPSPGTAGMLVQVYDNGAIPTAVDKFFAAHPVNPGGVEGENLDGTFAADSGTVFVLCVGPKVPVAGNYLMASSLGGRWVAEHGKGTAKCNVSPFCLPSFPTTAFVGDGLGTHTLTQTSVSTGSAAWQSSIETFPATTYKQVAGSGLPCDVDGGSLSKIRYVFTLSCITSGTDTGKLRGTLLKVLSLLCCGPFGGPFVLNFSAADPLFQPPGMTALGTRLFTCDDDVFDFDYPTMTPDGCGFPGNAIAVPGGGGLLSVTF